jgi:hypothetical protein
MKGMFRRRLFMAALLPVLGAAAAPLMAVPAAPAGEGAAAVFPGEDAPGTAPPGISALADGAPAGPDQAGPPERPEKSPGRLTWSFTGTLLVFPEENGPRRGAPMPLLPSPGAALACRLWGPLEAALSLDLYFTHYGYDWDLGRPLPVEIENRSAFVLGALTGLRAGVRIPLGSRGALRLYAGPAADLRLVVTAEDLHESDLSPDDPSGAPMQTDAVRDYMWGEGRWFFPFAGIGGDFPVNDRFLFGIDFRVWFPVYRYWTGEDLPPLEGWRFGPAFTITLR